MLLAGVSVTTNCAVSPSSTATPAIESCGSASSSLIVAVAVFASDFSVAFVGPLSVIVNASWSSFLVSWVVATETVLVVSPAVKVNVVLAAAV